MMEPTHADWLLAQSQQHFQKLAALSARAEGAQRMGRLLASQQPEMTKEALRGVGAVKSVVSGAKKLLSRGGSVAKVPKPSVGGAVPRVGSVVNTPKPSVGSSAIPTPKAPPSSAFNNAASGAQSAASSGARGSVLDDAKRLAELRGVSPVDAYTDMLSAAHPGMARASRGSVSAATGAGTPKALGQVSANTGASTPSALGRVSGTPSVGATPSALGQVKAPAAGPSATPAATPSIATAPTLSGPARVAPSGPARVSPSVAASPTPNASVAAGPSRAQVPPTYFNQGATGPLPTTPPTGSTGAVTGPPQAKAPPTYFQSAARPNATQNVTPDQIVSKGPHRTPGGTPEPPPIPATPAPNTGAGEIAETVAEQTGGGLLDRAKGMYASLPASVRWMPTVGLGAAGVGLAGAGIGAGQLAGSAYQHSRLPYQYGMGAPMTGAYPQQM